MDYYLHDRQAHRVFSIIIRIKTASTPQGFNVTNNTHRVFSIIIRIKTRFTALVIYGQQSLIEYFPL